MEFIKKSMYLFLHVQIQLPSKYSPFDAIHLSRYFLPLLKIVFELVDFDAF